VGRHYILRFQLLKNTLLALVLVCLKSAFAQVGLSPDELKLFNLLNHERVKAGVPEFQWNYQLAESARAHTKLMAGWKELSHRFSDEAALGDRVGATGLRFDVAAENVGAAPSVEDIHSGFMNSPQHRANILSPRYSAVGLAVISRDGELYVTEDFAHTLPSYSEEQFRAATIAAFNKARRENGIPSVSSNASPRLHELACSESEDAKGMLHDFPDALTLVIFTSPDPDKLPSSMEKAAADRSLHRLDIGVCFKPGKEHGYGSFRIVGAFYQ
jgi:uncharacterized protein YkwD